MEAEFSEITAKLEKERQTRAGFGRFMKHPVEVLTERPENILIVCIPVGLLFFIGGFIYMVRTYGMAVLFNSTSVDDFAVFAVLICIVPMAILDLKEQLRVKNLENALPNFFRDLAGMNDSGMTLPNAVHLVASAEYGTLTPHIHKLDNEMSWGVGFVDALYRFGHSLGTTLADRSVDLIAKASRAGGDVSEVLRAAAKDTYEIVNLRQERSNNMLIYVVIVLVAFCRVPLRHCHPRLVIPDHDGDDRCQGIRCRSRGVWREYRSFRLQAALRPRGNAAGILLGPRCRADG